MYPLHIRCVNTFFFRLPTDAPPPYVGSYPFRSSTGGATPATRVATREQDAQQFLAANLALHFASPAIADDDATVAQGLRYPQRYSTVQYIPMRAMVEVYTRSTFGPFFFWLAGFPIEELPEYLSSFD